MLKNAVEQMIVTFGDDARRINHALKVYGFASAIADLHKVSPFEREVISFAAILHDIGIQEAERKYGSSAGPYQEQEGPPIARRILGELGCAQDVRERVLFLIGHHHSYSAIDGQDFQILVEADFLVNIFEDGINEAQITSIRDKYFKTAEGTRILEIMYLRH